MRWVFQQKRGKWKFNQLFNASFSLVLHSNFAFSWVFQWWRLLSEFNSKPKVNYCKLIMVVLANVISGTFSRRPTRRLICAWESTPEQYWRAFWVSVSGNTTCTQRTLSWRTKWSQAERLGRSIKSKNLLSSARKQKSFLMSFGTHRVSVFFFSRVHISEKTLSFLHGEFEVEPAFGEKREEALRIAGLKTFFITKVLKPVRRC